jgi:hypothetical protein
MEHNVAWGRRTFVAFRKNLYNDVCYVYADIVRLSGWFYGYKSVTCIEMRRVIKRMRIRFTWHADLWSVHLCHHPRHRRPRRLTHINTLMSSAGMGLIGRIAA